MQLILRRDIDENYIFEFETFNNEIYIHNALDLIELKPVVDQPKRFQLVFKTNSTTETEIFESEKILKICKAIRNFVQQAEENFKYDHY
mmetsp:Transcript_124756/g.186357  ORF Transcript_124756/g.186357 Transcript_124756/m.186357 type:complete len:89 (+) Transcript_124756:21-287(+)